MTLDSLTFYVAELTLEQEGPNERLWRSPENCITKLTLLPGAAPRGFDLADLGSCAKFCSEEIGGTPMAMHVTTAGGCEVLYWLAKFWPEGSTGRFYAATIMVPFPDALFRIDIAANEHGTTGIRESTVLAIGPQIPGTPEWDDERFDTFFPAHPLSLVRSRLKEVLLTMALRSG
jgi:hypothetical protein